MTKLTQSKHVYLTLAAILAFIMIFAFIAAPSTARAADPHPRCGPGEAQSTLQAYLVARSNLEVSKAGLGGGAAHCRYPLFLDGATYTFQSDDLIVGGVANFIPLELLDVTVAEAVELLRASEDRVFLGPAGTPPGELVEQELTETAFKHIIDPVYGHIVYQQKAFITQLEPGDYSSRYEWSWSLFAPGTGVETVTLHIP